MHQSVGIVSFLRSEPPFIADVFLDASWCTLELEGPFPEGWLLAAGGLSATRRKCLPQFVFVSFILPGWPRNGLDDGVLLSGVCFRMIGVGRPVVLQSAEDAMPNIELGLVHNHECFISHV